MKAGDRVRVWGADPTDEVFTVETTGTFNITRLSRAIEAGTVACALWEMPIDEALLHHVGLRDIDKAHTLTISAERLAQPGIILRCPPIPPAAEEIGELVDGAHRIIRLHELGMKTAAFYAVTLADAEQFRVSHQIMRAGQCEWEPLDGRAILEATWGHYAKAPNP